MEVTLGNIRQAIELISILKSQAISTHDLKIIINSDLENNQSTINVKNLESPAPALPSSQSFVQEKLCSNENFPSLSEVEDVQDVLSIYSKKSLPTENEIRNILNKDRFILIKQRLIELASKGELEMEGYRLEDLKGNNTSRVLQKYFHTSRYHAKSPFSIWEKNSIIPGTLKTDEFISDLARVLKWDIEFVRNLLKIPSRKGKTQREIDENMEKKEEKISPLNARIGYKNFAQHVNQLIKNGKLSAPKGANARFNDYLAMVSKTTKFEVKDRNIFWIWQSLGQVKQMLNPEVVKNICKTFHLTEEEFTNILSNNQFKKSATN